MESVSDALTPIIETMRLTYSMDISVYDRLFLSKSIDKRLAATGIKSTPAYGETLSQNKAEAEAFFHSLKISYSEFFRTPLTFALLEQLILPGLIAAKEKTNQANLRIWSAGCAAGQEAYSVAILLDELAAAKRHPVGFKIIATDVSNAELCLARKGVYDQAAVQNVRTKHLHCYFSTNGETFTIAQRLRDQVDFSSYDLLDERSVCPPVSIYGDFDLILCSNLLFYYRLDIRQRILDKIRQALSPDGYFVTGESERDMVAKNEGFRGIVAPLTVFIRS